MLAAQPLVTGAVSVTAAARVPVRPRAYPHAPPSRKQTTVVAASGTAASSSATGAATGARSASRRRVVARAQSIEAAASAAAREESDAADGITPAFGEGSPPWPLVHKDLRDGTFGEVRTVSVQEASLLLGAGGAALADVRPRIEFEEFRAGGAEGDDSLEVRNVPYFVPHRSAAKRWQGYFLCTKDGLKERDWRFTRSFAVGGHATQ